MYAAIRQGKAKAGKAEELTRRIKEGAIPIISDVEGFMGYYVVYAPDDTVVAMLASAIDFIIPVENDGGARAIGEVWFAPDAARRGESFADLVRTI